jgi:molecular chaperone GrpE (heat shock protein)
MARGKQMKQAETRAEELIAKLEAHVADLEKQLDGAKEKLIGARAMLRAIRGEPEQQQKSARASNVKQTLLTLLDEAGAAGLNATMAVEAAARRNERIERPTVSSLLSRFKAEGVVAYDGSVYKLKKFIAPNVNEAGGAMH